MPDFLLELQGQHFRRAYLLYVVEIHHGREKYYYIGQTGDSRYTTARPAFRRLAGHLEDGGNSTQNQVYRYIASEVLGHPKAQKKRAFCDSLKQSVEDFLSGSTVRMHAYEAQTFDPKVRHDKHLAVRARVVSLEKSVIKAFRDAGRKVMNSSVALPDEPCSYQDLFVRIKRDFGI